MDLSSLAGIDIHTLGAVIVAAIILAVAARVLVILSAVAALIRVGAFLVLGCVVVGGVVYAKELVSGDITADDLTQFRHSVTESWPRIQERVDQVLPDADEVPAMGERARNAKSPLLKQTDRAE